MLQLSLEDSPACLFVGHIDTNSNVKAAFTNKGRIETVEEIRRRHQDQSWHASILVDALHQLDRYIVPASCPSRGTDSRISCASKDIDLVEEEQQWPRSQSIGDGIPEISFRFSNPHAQQFRTLDVAIIDLELSCRSLREECLSTPLRSMQENSISNHTIFPEPIRMPPVFHDLSDLLLGFFHPTNIGKRNIRPRRLHLRGATPC